MKRPNLLDTYLSEESKKEFVIEVHYQDLKADKYKKDRYVGEKLDDLLEEVFKEINTVTDDENLEFKFVGFPSNDSNESYEEEEPDEEEDEGDDGGDTKDEEGEEEEQDNEEDEK